MAAPLSAILSAVGSLSFFDLCCARRNKTLLTGQNSMTTEYVTWIRPTTVFSNQIKKKDLLSIHHNFLATDVLEISISVHLHNNLPTLIHIILVHIIFYSSPLIPSISSCLILASLPVSHHPLWCSLLLKLSDALTQ